MARPANRDSSPSKQRQFELEPLETASGQPERLDLLRGAVFPRRRAAGVFIVASPAGAVALRAVAGPDARLTHAAMLIGPGAHQPRPEPARATYALGDRAALLKRPDCGPLHG